MLVQICGLSGFLLKTLQNSGSLMLIQLKYKFNTTKEARIDVTQA